MAGSDHPQSASQAIGLAGVPRLASVRWLQIALGAVLTVFLRERVARVRAGRLATRAGMVDRLLVGYWAWRCERKGKLGALVPLHRWAWSQDSAVAFHTQTVNAFWRRWDGGQRAVALAVKQAIRTCPEPITQLYEIGCGGGFALGAMSELMPELDQLTGLDLSAAQTEVNQARVGQDRRIQYVCADAVEWLPEHARSGSAYVTYGGVLQYFSQSEVETLLNVIAARKAPALFACAEPIARNYDLERETVSRPCAPEHSLGHNYPHLMKAAGFEVVWQRELMMDRRWCLVVGRYLAPDD